MSQILRINMDKDYSMLEIDLEKLRDTLNELENMLDDVSQQCCMVGDVEDKLYDMQCKLDLIKEILK